MSDLVPTCVWTVTPALVVALDDRFGPPTDAYVNGSQVWLRDDGPNGATIEWRLHPVPGYRKPDGAGTYELFETVADAIARDRPGPAPLDRLWEGLEAFPAYGEELEPAPLAAACADDLGLPPTAAGLVDHTAIADAWEKSGRATSIVSALLGQLGSA